MLNSALNSAFEQKDLKLTCVPRRLWFPTEHDDPCRHAAHDPLCLYAGRDEFGTFVLARQRVGMVHIQGVEAAFAWERARL